MAKKTAPYGTWPSPITSDAIVQNSVSVSEVLVDSVSSRIYYVEKRPAEGGRNVVVRAEDGEDVFGPEWNSRTGVHEYGGAAAIVHDGVVYFSNFADSRVYSVAHSAEPEAITPENTNHRFANFAIHPQHSHFLVAVLEDHTKPAPADVVNTLCVIDRTAKTVSPLVAGADFYSAPCFSPDGKKLAWQEWYHPDMPWQGAEICVADVVFQENALTVTNRTLVAGERKKISAGYPEWVTNDQLLFTSDASGYQNPWLYSSASGKAAPVLATPVAEDFAAPAWTLGGSYGTALDKEGKTALFTAMRDGRSVLYAVSLRGGTLAEVACPYVTVSGVRRIVDDTVVFLGAKSDDPGGIVLCSVSEHTKPLFYIVRAAASADAPRIPQGYISAPRPLTLKALPGEEPLFAVFYPPANPEYDAPRGAKPPCVVSVHGGPTGVSTQDLHWKVQYFTSRGWAWLDVNYGGSSGYGREYTARLEGQWGVVDVWDCVSAVQQVGAAPLSLIDPARAVITGGSAGGFTVLAALCQYPDAFAAGTSSYGISDLRKLDEFTHKFESRYCEGLVGGTVAQIPDVYRTRSPLFGADKIRAPLLILQGSLDAVVPPGQAEDMVRTIKERGGMVDYVLFEGEGHGWRKAENIKAALEKEIGFYQEVLDLGES